MPLFRNKPIVVEAVRFDQCKTHKLQLPEGVKGIPSPGADNWAYMGCQFWVDTLQGRMNVKDGDWIIYDRDTGDMSVCSPEFFEREYESIKE